MNLHELIFSLLPVTSGTFHPVIVKASFLGLSSTTSCFVYFLWLLISVFTWSWCGVPQDEHAESTLDWLVSAGKDLVFRQYSGYSAKNRS